MKTIKTICASIHDKGTDISKWEYDDRFGTALTAFETDKSDELFKTLGELFESQWDHKTIKKAPKPVKKIAKHFSGVSKEQFLFSTSAESEKILIAAWWPWGDGGHASLRVTLFDNEKKIDISDETLAELKSMFSLK